VVACVTRFCASVLNTFSYARIAFVVISPKPVVTPIFIDVLTFCRRRIPSCSPDFFRKTGITTVCHEGLERIGTYGHRRNIVIRVVTRFIFKGTTEFSVNFFLPAVILFLSNCLLLCCLRHGYAHLVKWPGCNL